MKKHINYFFETIFPIILIGIFSIIINLKVFPLTEGWWETFAWLSEKQKIYIDFNMPLPPLYVNITQILLHITNKLLILRWIWLVIYFINIFIIFKLCKLLTKSNFSLLGIFASQILLICNNPVWLSKDYHTLVALLVNIFSIFFA